MASTHPRFEFSSPYPEPQYDYPSSNSRISIFSRGSKAPLRRPPSPTPSERVEMNQPFLNIKQYARWDFLRRPKVLIWGTVLLTILILTSLIAIYHKQIEDWLRPAADWMQHLKFGWLIPIAILFVISFPPLFGHEIVAVLCGNVWGLWIGFGIVAAGTVLGEIGNFYAFKYICQARANKAENGSWWYACLARTVRQGGFKIAVMARLSAIPGHFTTAIFATCGMNILVFTVAAILSMPKQFITVYLGVLLEESADPTNKPNSKHQIISYAVLAVTTLITIGAGWYIYRKMCEQRLDVVRERRARLGRSSKMGSNSMSSHPDPSDSATSLDVFNPSGNAEMYHKSDAYQHGYITDHAPIAPQPQRWDNARPLYGTEPQPYEDPYEYNSYPMGAPPAQQVYPNPYGSQYPPAANPQPTAVSEQREESGWVQEHGPESPFDDRHSVFPNTVPNAADGHTTDMRTPTQQKYALNDTAPPHGAHEQEESSATFYTTHSRFPTTDSDLR